MGQETRHGRGEQTDGLGQVQQGEHGGAVEDSHGAAQVGVEDVDVWGVAEDVPGMGDHDWVVVDGDNPRGRVAGVSDRVDGAAGR